LALSVEILFRDHAIPVCTCRVSCWWWRISEPRYIRGSHNYSLQEVLRFNPIKRISLVNLLWKKCI